MENDLDKIDPDWAWSPYQPDDLRPWNRSRAAHLYRRAGFSASSKQLDDAVTYSPAELVQHLLRPGNTMEFERKMDGFGKTILANRNPQSLSAWWLYRMLRTPDQLLEKMTLFWHGHFATSAEKVSDATAILRQNGLLREHARGDFAKLVLGISQDPAMLIYLDSTTNRKTHPNENYARELMELFCLGPGNYTEQDIQEVARCFTGWELRRGKFVFNPYQHDRGTKSFFGQSGPFGGEDAVRIVLEQKAAPRFIVRKLIRFFIFDEPEPPDTLVEPLARKLHEDDLKIGPLLGRILGSQLFFSEYAIGRKIRSPVELSIGLLRALEGQTNIFRLSHAIAGLGQSPFYPPNVKGWDGGRSWINSSTLLGRANLVGQILQSENSKFAGGDLQSLIKQHGVKTPDAMVDWLLALLVAVPVPNEVREMLVDLGRSRKESTNQRIANVIHTISSLPEFQLC